jgi:iron complex outermembrane recepter protein
MKTTIPVALLAALLAILHPRIMAGPVCHRQPEPNVIRGLIRDGAGTPITGATVIIRGTSVYSVADTEGHFSIAAPENLPFTLLINMVGYRAMEVEVYELMEEPLDIVLAVDGLLAEVVVTSRRREENAQNIPISVAVVDGTQLNETGAFNVNRVKELVPAVQFYSSNPRNTTLNIRGLGSTFGLTNDGIEPGVGFYVDGVYYARPAAASLDFIDVAQIEVLRGPQGTLFGKNTTAGALNITTRKPDFSPEFAAELSYGNFGYIQAKSSINGPLGDKFAARLSFAGTQRDGLLYNTSTRRPLNDLNNLGLRGQLLYAPTQKLEVVLAADASRQRPDGYAQVYAGTVATLRPDYRQFDAIIADLGYRLPHEEPFDRKIDHDTPWKSGNDLGGISLNMDAETAGGTITSTTAWRYWNWDPSNDRDFTGLQALALSQAPSRHNQWSQEIRYSGDFFKHMGGTVGLFLLGQQLRSDDVHTEESGKDQWRFVQRTTSELWATPGLFEGYGIHTRNELHCFSGAVFGQLDWEITDRLHLLPGIRLNYDYKYADYDRKTYGGLVTDDPALIALKESVYNDQQFTADADALNLSGQITLAYRASDRLNAFLTASTNYKPIGINLGGLPREGNRTMTELAVVDPEKVHHFELGIKTRPTPRSTLNLTTHNTRIQDYQTLVQTPDLSVNRGYLANAEKVRVLGFELDGNIALGRHLRLSAAMAFTDGKYVTFTNAPPPLESTGGDSFVDISGGELPGISRWAITLGGEILSGEKKVFASEGILFLGFDTFYRSSFSSSPSPSRYLNVDGYALLNARAGFRGSGGISLFLWARNLLNQDYFELLLPGAGNVGHYAAVLGDPATFGITLRCEITPQARPE